MNRYFVTGASGYIGSNLVREITKRGGYVCASARNSKKLTDVASYASDVVSFDLLDVGDWSSYFSGIDVVIHCAGLAHIFQNTSPGTTEESFNKINIDGTLKIAKYALTSKVKKFVFISSIGVNGSKNTGQPFKYDDQPQPSDAYTRSKYEAELALVALFESTNVDLIIVRPPLVYGPGAPGNINRLWRAVGSGLPLPLGSLSALKSFVSIENLVDMLIHCSERENVQGYVFLASDDSDISTAELVKIMYATYGKRSRLVPVPLFILRFIGKLVNKAEVVDKISCRLQVDISHTKSTLGWAPKTSLPYSIALSAPKNS